uniref:F-box only protein 43 n=1 Tax=Doryrhamphus excisus TaxID=161450 RepID=UPI0025ADB251|nr:F-box only protein 43 [Doryrhamphus excisus]
MQCTPESSVYYGSCKGQQRCESSDSGYSGFFHSPHSINGLNSCGSLPDFSDTPKENFRPSVTPKEKTRDLIQPLHKHSNRVTQTSAVNWCETPKVYKRDAPLRHRLPMCNATNDQSKRSPCTANTSRGYDHWLSVSFESLDTVPQTSNSSALNLKQDSLSGRKRRLLFSQVRTSTLEDGTLGLCHRNSLERHISLLDDFRDRNRVSDQVRESPCLSTSSKENLPSPVGNLYYSSDVLCTPSSTQTPKHIGSLCEDSGFSSLTPDESQDSSVNHDGSFQELLPSSRKGNSGTPNLTDAKRRSRLQRQHRLSTLKEGGSQSEEDPSDRTHQPCRQSSSKDDNVFISATPRRVLALKYVNTSSGGLASTRHSGTTPLRDTTVKLHSEPPSSAKSVNSEITPLKTTVANLSLTPALQMVHILSQQRAQMFAGASPSLKEQIRLAESLARTPIVCKTTMPLAGLIGRKMGLEKVDILTELRKRNLRHILAVILGLLSAECINRCGHVCKGWEEIIQQDKQARFRRESHRLEVEASREVGGTVPDSENRLTRSKRSVLQTIQTQSTTSSHCTPQSGTRTLPLGSSRKWDKFVEVAKTLFNDECLRHCPRCQHPAKCHSVKGEGVCTRDDCSFRFCTACLCAFHGSKECDRQSVGLHKKDVLLPGSAQRRRSIRRL